MLAEPPEWYLWISASSMYFWQVLDCYTKKRSSSPCYKLWMAISEMWSLCKYDNKEKNGGIICHFHCYNFFLFLENFSLLCFIVLNKF